MHNSIYGPLLRADGRALVVPFVNLVGVAVKLLIRLRLFIIPPMLPF